MKMMTSGAARYLKDAIARWLARKASAQYDGQASINKSFQDTFGPLDPSSYLSELTQRLQ